MSAPADLSGEEAAALEIMSKRFLLAMIASLTPSEFQRYRDALADVGVPLSSDLPVRVALDPDPSGVSVGVWQGPRCIYTGAHPLPAPAADGAPELLRALEKVLALLSPVKTDRDTVLGAKALRNLKAAEAKIAEAIAQQSQRKEA